MTETHDRDREFKAYIIVFALLSVFTAVSFVANYFEHEPHRLISPHTGLAIIMGVAFIKALCVAFIFMHLKKDWGKVFFIVVPVVVMGLVMMIVLLPDMVLAWNYQPVFGVESQPGVPVTLSEPQP